MGSKPDKFGIKYWICSEVESKYCFNQFPYLGAQDNDTRQGERLGDFVVKKLHEPLVNKGYHITTDNFFTSLSLSNYLMAKKTTLAGTVRLNSKFVCPAQRAKKPLHTSEHFTKDENVVVAYQCKNNKKVILLSSFHQSTRVEAEGKCKPEIVKFYNKTKVAVDSMDAMLRLYSTKSATRRWPLAVFFDILDKAALNSWILHNKSLDSKISRRDFIIDLAKKLCGDETDFPVNKPVTGQDGVVPTATLKRKTCQVAGCENKTNSICNTCNKLCCGKHSLKVFRCSNCQ